MLEAATTPRDRALVALLVGCGLRAGEVVALDAGDVLEGEGGIVLHVRQGKGRKDRTVLVPGDVAVIIRGHLHREGGAWATIRARSRPCLLGNPPGGFPSRGG